MSHKQSERVCKSIAICYLKSNPLQFQGAPQHWNMSEISQFADCEAMVCDVNFFHYKRKWKLNVNPIHNQWKSWSCSPSAFFLFSFRMRWKKKGEGSNSLPRYSAAYDGFVACTAEVRTALPGTHDLMNGDPQVQLWRWNTSNDSASVRLRDTVCKTKKISLTIPEKQMQKR